MSKTTKTKKKFFFFIFIFFSNNNNNIAFYLIIANKYHIFKYITVKIKLNTQTRDALYFYGINCNLLSQIK